jgi:hypothetical protein
MHLIWKQWPQDSSEIGNIDKASRQMAQSSWLDATFSGAKKALQIFLCPPFFQCAAWHTLLQYLTLLQREQTCNWMFKVAQFAQALRQVSLLGSSLPFCIIG